ncbi:MAG TPA: alpha-L-arabinofuranosidase C-terminal domain-containing protein [Bacteroidales bacterium]|jgi:alpha-L-arabinofuranosidase|nr:alpha-L-arabinofuranosidase C-terminal domain-containing protein [Bacteroidales bacterium]
MITVKKEFKELLNVHLWNVWLLSLILLFLFDIVTAQTKPEAKKISPRLFGLFIEDINYAADGGLYAELVQNRSFEYDPTEQKGWNPLSFWEYISPGFSIGRISVETTLPVHFNNPHYLVLDIEHVGHEAGYAGESGVGIKNYGFEGMVVKAGDLYNLSLFIRQLSSDPVTIKASLQTNHGKTLAKTVFSTNSNDWKKYVANLIPSESSDSATLTILAISKGKIAMDVVSLFPERTFMNRPNGLRADLARVLADMQPAFIRFPGGCLVHGDGLGNMYRWKNTIGPVEQRKEQRNLWGYHQTAGLGFFEYFQFCEDINAEPLPVLPAAVSCQNSGGTWRIGGTGQKALPLNEMQEYIQEILDLIEWANGPETSEWGAKRAAAGHPAPFGLEYIGIGNEDKITPEFEERFTMIFNVIKARHPEITVIGTSGPFHSGEDFQEGWKLANDLNVPVVDEHYYTQPEWLLGNLQRYDHYSRQACHVYLGEYASWGNKVRNAIAEAAYMISLERNGDVIKMASYAPLLAKKGFTQWKTDMIFFDNVNICPTPNYYVQKLFSVNRGDLYFNHVISKEHTDTLIAVSCVQNSLTGDIIIKLVNAGNDEKTIGVNLSKFKQLPTEAEQTVLTGDPDAENTFENPGKVVPVVSLVKISKSFNYKVLAMSLTVIRIKSK